MIYVTKDYANIIFVNLKCCYGSFEAVTRAGHLNRFYTLKQFQASHVIKKIGQNVKLWCVVRNPYHRFASFYKDKFIYSFTGKFTDGVPHDNLGCQHEMYKFYPEEKIRNLEFKISDLVDAIKKGYKDQHLEPQTDILKCNIFNKEVTFVKMEDPNFRQIIQNILGVNFPHYNQTNSSNYLSELTPSDRQYIFDMYQKDFDTFGYSHSDIE